jgi:hypothetical protein
MVGSSTVSRTGSGGDQVDSTTKDQHTVDPKPETTVVSHRYDRSKAECAVGDDMIIDADCRR